MNEVFSLPGQPQLQAEVILASKGSDSPRITTMRVRCPRIIWPEILTHRTFSRNARSSRAVPFKTLLAELRNGGGFTPWHWTANQPGMQGVGGHNTDVEVPREYDGSSWPYSREEAWQEARQRAIEVSSAFSDAGYHKQLCNRLIEPFMMIDGLITATDWENFWWLRDHGDAEPHLQDLAKIMKQAYDAAKVQMLKPGEWHLPYITDEDRNQCWSHRRKIQNRKLLKISAARCARVSYAPFDGDASYEKEFARYDMLVSSDRVHASPVEHQAKPDTKHDEDGWGLSYDNPELHGNLTGWIQARKLLPNENYSGS